MSADVQSRSRIDILETPKARPTRMTVLDAAMTKEYALPIKNADGQVQEIVYAGRIVNRDNYLVDRIRKLVFGDAIYEDKPVGTVTVFMNDVRVSTNVLDEAGLRAIGTRVSDEVYTAVVEDGQRWLDRAFVVTHWYRTAYEPIHNVNGDIIGILYVGILEEPFNDMTARIVAAFILVILFGAGLAFVFSLILTGSIVKPMTEVLTATRKMADGQLGHEVTPDKTISELNQLAKSFNEMSLKLKERESSLKLSNEKMTELNKTYQDLLGFVAHELKGLLSSAVINAYSIRDGFLGMINFKQKKAVVSICRNLDFLDATVKKFLNLSRIERGNLEVNRTEFVLNKDIFAMSVETFSKMAQDKKITISNQIDPELKVKADMDLMQIVANNLVNNAIKYGQEGGQVLITTKDKGGFVTVEVYNDSTPIPVDKIDRLFKKFSRLDMPSKKKVKGTGLGLYITKQIVEAHGGNIRVEAKENGNSFIFTISKE
ncbi:MAG: cache domain-containing protein, partial [Planctomycetota bacterium]|jgi:two-component system NtrC family sensor kinase